MKILIISFILSSSIWACEFHKDYKKIYSLSGVSTQIIKELGLISSPRLQGISVFHPVNEKEFKGKFLGGGQFISFAEMDKWNSGLVLYDESRELHKILSRKKDLKALEIKTRGKTPTEVISAFIEETKHVFHQCDLEKLKTDFSKKITELKSVIPKKMKLIIYLGEITKYKYPEIIMVNDGVVRFLSHEKLIQTYPSELAYPNWSAKIMNSLDKDFIKLGIIDSGNKLTKKLEKVSEKNYNLTYPGAMIPGIGQVEALFYFFSRLDDLL